MDEPSRGAKANTNVLFRTDPVWSFFCGNVAPRDLASAAFARYPTNVGFDRAVP
jgi:hypothetical protein